MKIWPGQPYPLGATWDGSGTNFSLFSEAATRVELCLFDGDGAGARETRVDLPENTALCWHGYLPQAGPGQRYGYRVHGPWAPQDGHRCHPSKLLIDPYAKAIAGDIHWDESVFGYRFDDPGGSINDADSAPFVPKSVVVNPFFDWSNDRKPAIPWHKTVVYEAHVRGLTMRHPGIPAELRGTYAGLAHPAAIAHLQQLGITAIELMPVHHFVHDSVLAERGLRNYWGYNSIGFLAPYSGYSSAGADGQQVQEFKQMVKTMHAAGIEVILDVVYNHTAEGNHMGPILSMKGIDNKAYYRLMADEPEFYMDYTGTGNSMNMRHPHVLQLIMDSLRYWAIEMHVDGFRFDLAAALARELHEVDRLSAFFDIIQQDPVISQMKLIAEPWDVGEGGYHVGNFPPLWSEWNGKYRDTVRDYWRGGDETMAEFAYRFTGSSDLYANTARRPYASVNFITAHDGFTLRDLVSYSDKHNEANGEENRDGENHNRSWNMGAEGPTNDPAIARARDKQVRNFLATLFLSQGVPMLVAGDEMGRTQGGNNNAYCQDNEISWVDWEHGPGDLLATHGLPDAAAGTGAPNAASDPGESLLEFTRTLSAFRHAHPVFRRRRWFQGRSLRGTDVVDIGWFTPSGEPMSEEDWRVGFAKSLAVFLNGQAIPTPDSRGERVVDDTFFVLLNAHHEPMPFTIPPGAYGQSWRVILDTDTLEPVNEQRGDVFPSAASLTVAERSLVVLKRLA